MERGEERRGDTVKLPLDRIFMARPGPDRPTEIDRADEHAAPSLGQSAIQGWRVVIYVGGDG